MKYTHKKVIDIPIYEGKFVIILSNDPNGIKKILPSYDRENIYAHTWYTKYKKHQGYFVVLNFDNKYNKITHGTIAHEAQHCVNILADIRGFIPDFENDEPTTYLLGWFVDEIYKFVKEKGFKVKTK